MKQYSRDTLDIAQKNLSKNESKIQVQIVAAFTITVIVFADNLRKYSEAPRTVKLIEEHEQGKFKGDTASDSLRHSNKPQSNLASSTYPKYNEINKCTSISNEISTRFFLRAQIVLTITAVKKIRREVMQYRTL